MKNKPDIQQMSVHIPPIVNERPQSNLYRVYINGHPCPVYDTPIFFELNNQSRMVSYSHFDFTGSVRVVVESMRPVKSVRIRPLSREIKYHVQDNLISFTLIEPTKLSVEINGGIDDNLHLFGSNPEVDIPLEEDPNVIYYGPGIHYIDGEYGFLELKSDQTLYLAPGAVLHARIYAEDAENIRICGRGVVLGSTLLGRQPHYYHKHLGEPEDIKRPRFVQFHNCHDIVVEGIMLNDTPSWALVFDHCRHVLVRDIKQFGYVDNSDAIDVVSSSDVVIDDVFLRANDDCVVIKAKGDSVSNVLVQNSVLWSDRAQALQIGHELITDTVSQIIFRNIDVLEQRNRYVGHYAIGIYNGDHAVVSDVLFENIRIENHYRMIGLIIDKGFYGHTEERGTIQNITFRNIDSKTTLDLHITGWDTEHGIRDVVFENLTINGQPATPEIYHNLFVQNLTFKENGDITRKISQFVSPDTEYVPIDISNICNRSRIDEQAGDGEGWLDLGPELDMRHLQGGIQVFRGIPFHIPEDPKSGALILRSSMHLIEQPYWSYPVNLDCKVKYLFFLQGTAFTNIFIDKVSPEVWIGGAGKLRFNLSETGTPLWYYRIRYKDNGMELKVPVKAGWNVEDWEIWAPGGWVVRLGGKKFYIQQWDNPYPQREISTVKVETALQPEVPILLGMTAGK